jgi:hypothetical protein
VKIDVLQFLGAKKSESAHKGKATPGFEAALHAQAPRAARAQVPQERDEKKPRAATGTEEALLVARGLAVHARPAPTALIVTKQPDLKDAKIAKTIEPTMRQAVTVEQLVTRSKVQHEPARVTGPTEKKPARGELREPGKELKKGEEPVFAATTPTLTPTTSPEPFRLEAPTAIRDAAPLAPLAPQMMDDPSLRIVLLPTVARMSMDTGEGGRLNVQLKVRDGVTEVHATGPASQLLESRQGELRVALAKEGLALGHFDLTQSGSQQRHERPELDSSIPPTTRRATSSQDPATDDGRVHVKA